MDPLTIATLWLKIRPIRRWREARAARKAQEATLVAGQTTTAAPAAEDEGMFSELAKSWARSALKIVGTTIAAGVVTHGWVDGNSADSLNLALEAIGGGVLTIFGLWWSHRTHKAA